MENFEKIEGTANRSTNYVCDGQIFVKNFTLKEKIYLRCHSWRENCELTAELQHGYLNFVKDVTTPLSTLLLKTAKVKNVQQTFPSLRQKYDLKNNGGMLMQMFFFAFYNYIDSHWKQKKYHMVCSQLGVVFEKQILRLSASTGEREGCCAESEYAILIFESIFFCLKMSELFVKFMERVSPSKEKKFKKL